MRNRFIEAQMYAAADHMTEFSDPGSASVVEEEFFAVQQRPQHILKALVARRRFLDKFQQCARFDGVWAAGKGGEIERFENLRVGFAGFEEGG